MSTDTGRRHGTRTATTGGAPVRAADPRRVATDPRSSSRVGDPSHARPPCAGRQGAGKQGTGRQGAGWQDAGKQGIGNGIARVVTSHAGFGTRSPAAQPPWPFRSGAAEAGQEHEAHQARRTATSGVAAHLSSRRATTQAGGRVRHQRAAVRSCGRACGVPADRRLRVARCRRQGAACRKRCCTHREAPSSPATEVSW